MALSWILGKKEEEGEKRREINEIREGRTPAYKSYASSELPYRILSSLYIVSLVVVMGVWSHQRTVVTERAEFPTGEGKIPVTLTLHTTLAITSPSLTEMGERVRGHLEEWKERREGMVGVRVEMRVGEVEERSLSSLLSPTPFTPFTPSSSLDLFIGLVEGKEWRDFSATSVLMTKGKWALVQVREGEDAEKIKGRIDQLIEEVLVGIGHLELIVKRDRRERIEPWQIAAMSPDHQKRLTWDCNSLSSSYSIRLIHLHSSPSLSPPPSSSSLYPSMIEMGRRVERVTRLEVKSEHVWDAEVDSYLEEDVQGRMTLTQANLHSLLKELDSLISPTQSIDTQLKIVIIHSERKIVMVDAEGDDSLGVGVSEWGGVMVEDERVTEKAIAAVRMLLGMDSHLPPGFKRAPSPLSEWELTRLSIRSIVDSSLRTKHAIRALRGLLREIDNLVFSPSLSSLISSSISSLREGLEDGRRPDIGKIKEAVERAEAALMDKSLLSLLYFPTEQRFGIFLPLIALYFMPALSLVPRIIYYAILRK